MIEGSSIRDHGVMMLSLVKKLKDLQADFEDEETYNMNGLEESLYELINMLVYYEATVEKSIPSVLVGEASTSKRRAKLPDARRGRRMRRLLLLLNTSSAPIKPLGRGKEKRKRVRQSRILNPTCNCYF
ncbi:UNVERIFIED_CONTAM: hypothetical protein Slati_2700900 [Sesamum latifolium]|uniref:Uncharacterized protein n=1 Tax=Sesamum latifolium TaxID=2727402 RepID=A0AAW2VZ14_9LAMI